MDEVNVNLLNERAIMGLPDSIFKIEVDGDGTTDRNFGKDPYFKIFDGGDFVHSKNKTRIFIFTPHYNIHNNDIWVLTTNEISELIRLLNANTYPFNIPVWEYILHEVIEEGGNYKSWTLEQKKAIENTKMPDYSTLTFRPEQYQKYAGKIKSWRKRK